MRLLHAIRRWVRRMVTGSKLDRARHRNIEAANRLDAAVREVLKK